MKIGDRVKRSKLGPHPFVKAGTMGTIIRIAPRKPCNGYWLVQFDGTPGLYAYDEQYLELLL